MVDVQTSEMDAKLPPVNVEPRNFVYRTSEDELLVKPFFAKEQKY
jgi:hypothetical protein